MMERMPSKEKLSAGTREKIEETLGFLEDDLHCEIETEETPDIITLKIKDKDGQIVKEMSFMKFDYLPVENERQPLEKVIEARLRFPDNEIKEAIRKVEKLKRKNEHP